LSTKLASGKLVLDEPADHLARIGIANQEKRGALDHEMLDALAETVRSLEGVRCLVITGSGKMFSAGYDIGNLEGATFAEAAERLVAHPFHAALEALEDFRFPVVAAINGHAIGGGLELALTADMRVCAVEAKLGMPPAKLGLIYSFTGLQKFLDVCGPAYTSELFHVGSNVGAERGLQMGLVNEVVPAAEVEARAMELAGEIAANAPLSLAGNKRIIRTLMHHRLPETTVRELVDLRESCFTSDDFYEGVKSFAEKRKPDWKGH
jgi:enoyl-CoA hydratase/carnithine racemase